MGFCQEDKIFSRGQYKEDVMVDIHTIIADHQSKNKATSADQSPKKGNHNVVATLSEIPDVFFDKVLVQYKLSRIEIMLIMYLYRQVWCRPNLYKEYGISQLMSHTELARVLAVTIDEIYHGLRKLEEFGFIATVRSGQYFVRKYFTKEDDELFAQTYNDFEI